MERNSRTEQQRPLLTPNPDIWRHNRLLIHDPGRIGRFINKITEFVSKKTYVPPLDTPYEYVFPYSCYTGPAAPMGQVFDVLDQDGKIRWDLPEDSAKQQSDVSDTSEHAE